MSHLLFDVGRAIKTIREERGMTQGRIAKKNNWERSYISDLERGKIKNPTFDTILQLVYALGVGCDEFIKAAYGFKFELSYGEKCPVCGRGEDGGAVED